jgi:hypothetical protein
MHIDGVWQMAFQMRNLGPLKRERKATLLWVRISVDGPQLVELMGRNERLCDVKTGVFLEDPRVGEEGAEVTICNVFLGEVDAFCILEGVEETDES